MRARRAGKAILCRPHPLALLVLSLFCAPGSAGAGSSGSITLRTVRDVGHLSNDRARQAFPVRLEGVVTYSDPEWGLLFLRDATGSIYINVHGSITHYPVGTRIRISGITGPGDVAPVVIPHQVLVVGREKPPAPELRSISDLNAGRADSKWVATEGVLHPCDGTWNRICFRIFDGNNVAWLVIPERDNPRAESLIGATVRAKGVSGVHLNAQNQRVAAQLFVNSIEDIAVEAPAPDHIFTSAPQPVGSLRSTDTEGRFVHELHMRGVVTWESPTRFIVQDASGAMLVETQKNVAAAFGSTVDVAGFPRHGEFGLELSDAAVQLSSTQLDASFIEPADTTAAAAIRRSRDGWRVHLKARLIGQSATAAGYVFQLEDGEQRFIATLPRRDGRHEFMSVTPGSVLEVTGVAMVRKASREWPESLQVLIESPADVVVEGGMGWLTVERAFALLGGLGICAIVSFVWVSLLRRTVRRQMEIIRARLENEMHLETRFRRLFERNLAAVFTWRRDGTIVDTNMAFVHLLGYESRQALIGRSYWDFEIEPGERKPLAAASDAESLSNREATLRRDDGSIVHLLQNITPVETPESLVYETTAIDVTLLRKNQAELKQAKETAEYEALNDPLTGLPNRRFVLDTLSTLTARARQEAGRFALLYLDLDGFKLINDSLGHPVGDALLAEVGARLRAWMRDGDTLARLGGDEFMVILASLQDHGDAALVAENLLDAISTPFHVKGHELSIGASIGISIFPDSAADAEELMQQADSAMYAAKREGKNRVMSYVPEIGSQINERSTLENLLRGAVGRNEISVHYQPEFDLKSGRLVRFEALARWTHPNLGAISPGEFIPIAEESGLISPLGAFIMEQACHEAVRWQAIVPTPIQIAVNISTLQLRRKGFAEEVRGILARTGLRPELLQIELTESAMLGEGHSVNSTLTELRGLGVSMVIDDFGTGYSNLSYLPALPLDALKIDQSFMRNAGAQAESDSMIRTLIALAHNIGLKVIVEGVERPDQLELVRSMGADEVQGFLLGRPSPNPQEVLHAAIESIKQAV